MDTGTLTLKSDKTFYTLYFPSRGWMAADMLQYLDDVLAASERPIAILKLLGYTMRITASAPERAARHWVEIDLDQHLLATNSEIVRLAVRGEDPPPEAPYPPRTLARIHDLLDRHDFTVELFS